MNNRTASRMKLLVYSHSLQIGGSQIVAVNLAGAMRECGHDVLLAGPSGPLTEVAASKGLRVVPIPRRGDRRPSLESAIALRRVIHREQVDLVHAYSHSACIEAFFAGYVFEGLPLICSARGHVAPRPFPKSLPMIVAQAHVREDAIRLGQRHVYLMRPVVDTDENSPQADVADRREWLGASADAANLVIVSRLVNSIKLRGIQQAIDAVAVLAAEMPVRLIIVGDGPARGQLTEHAEIVNRRLRRHVVTFAGEMVDPRPAYRAADVVLGMQGAILRGMAFAKPAIVLGQRGFSEVVTPDTVDRFLHDQFSGMGEGDLSPDRLVIQLAELLGDAALREQMGNFGRQIVCENVSLHAAADQIEQIYQTHGAEAPTRLRRLEEGLRLSGAIAWRKLARHRDT